MDDLKKRARQALMNIKKLFGDESATLLGDESAEGVATISTGSLGLDRALGVGGVPRGRIVEIYGPEASGKTTLMLNLVASAQRAGGLAAYIDTEHALDRAYAVRLGVDVDALLLSQPDSGEEALDIVEHLVREAKVELIVVDSVAALVPQAEIDGDMGDQHVGLQARLMSQALRKLAPAVHKSGATLCFVNQIRHKIGVTFGSPETTTGGRALRFYSSVRLDIRRIGGLKEKEEVTGNRVRVRVVKNKVAPPHGSAEFDILFGSGVDRFGELVDHGVAAGLVQKSGAWFSMGESRLGQGRTKACEALRQSPAMAASLETAIRAAWASGARPASGFGGASDDDVLDEAA